MTAKFTGPALANGWGWYVSGEFGRYWLGTTDTFYGSVNFPAGTPLPDYYTWNVGLGFTYKAITIDLRYYDTDLTKAECNVLTGDHTATFATRQHHRHQSGRSRLRLVRRSLRGEALLRHHPRRSQVSRSESRSDGRRPSAARFLL